MHITVHLYDTAVRSTQNVVVMTQPSFSPSTLTVEEEMGRKPNDYLVLTGCTIILCLMLGSWSALVCLIPAALFSLAVS